MTDTVYGWHGWERGEDVSPEEPGKAWLTITTLDEHGDANGDELAVIVLRDFDTQPISRVEEAEATASHIVEALNSYERVKAV